MGRETLTSRERVIRTLRRETVDRTPIDLGSHSSSNISAFAYRNLRRHLNLAVDAVEITDPVQFLARVEVDVLKRFHCDSMLLQPPWPTTRRWRPREDYTFILPDRMKPEREPEGAWTVNDRGPDGKGPVRKMRMPAHGFFFEGDWLNASYWWGGDDALLTATAREAERLYHETDYALICWGFPAPFGGLEMCVRMLTDPEEVHEANRRTCDAMIERFRKVNDLMGRYVQMVKIGDDMGTQNGPLCRPELIDEFCGPYYRRFCEFVHNHSDIKVFMHNCGSIRPLIPLLIDWGIDVLNPVQISAADMAPADLKRDFGDRIVFWGGGCDTQHVLGSAAVDRVCANVRELMGIFARGGGYVFNPVHNIMGNVPPEHVVALFDTAYACSFNAGTKERDES